MCFPWCCLFSQSKDTQDSSQNQKLINPNNKNLGSLGSLTQNTATQNSKDFSVKPQQEQYTPAQILKGTATYNYLMSQEFRPDDLACNYH